MSSFIYLSSIKGYFILLHVHLLVFSCLQGLPSVEFGGHQILWGTTRGAFREQAVQEIEFWVWHILGICSATL